jgi:hypothetical protein
VILKATSFLEGHKRDMGMTSSITQLIYGKIMEAIVERILIEKQKVVLLSEFKKKKKIKEKLM